MMKFYLKLKESRRTYDEIRKESGDDFIVVNKMFSEGWKKV